MVNIIAFDPGGTTGVAHYSLQPRNTKHELRAMFHAFQCTQESALEYARATISQMNRARVSIQNGQTERSARANSDETRSARAMSTQNESCSRSAQDLIIVYERFVVQGRTHRLSAQHDAQDLIGSLQAMCHEHDVPCYPQNVSEAKHVGTTQRLKRHNMWTQTLRHANDAAGHILFALIRLYPNEASELFKGARLVVRP